MELHDFDILKIDSSAITLHTPRALAKQLMKALKQDRDISAASEQENYLYRAMSNIAVAAALSNSPAEVFWLKDLITFLECGYGCSLRIDIANDILPYLSFQGRTVTFLPDSVDTASVEQVFDGISEIAYNEPHTNHWIFDCSQIKEVTAAFIGHCVGLKHSVAKHGSRISFLWLPRTALPKQFETVLQKHFFLAKKGVFLLSLEANPQSA